MQPEGKHPSLPPATPDGCPHEHLRFVDGQLHIACIDCEKHWGALTNRGGPMDYNMAGKIMFSGRDTRHDRWVLPRTQPLPKDPPPAPKHKRSDSIEPYHNAYGKNK
jgi:hypothetical protein